MRTLACIALLAASTLAAHADVTYTYHGSNYTEFYVPDYKSDPLSGYITFTAPLTPNSTQWVTPTSAHFSDGVQTYDLANSPGSYQLTTDGNDQLTSWTISVESANTSDAVHLGSSGVEADRDGYPVAATPDPGYFTMSSTTPTPEPSSLALLGTGLAGVSAALRKRLQGRSTL